MFFTATLSQFAVLVQGLVMDWFCFKLCVSISISNDDEHINCKVKSSKHHLQKSKMNTLTYCPLLEVCCVIPRPVIF